MQNSGEWLFPFLPALPFAILFGSCCAFFFFGFVLDFLVCLFLRSCLLRIPMVHRKQQPALVFLLLIPVFNIIWSFFVFPAVANSFKSYFDSIGRTDVTDCGCGLAIALCILFCFFIIPYTIPCFGLVVLILLILLLARFSRLKAKIHPNAV